ncbi:MAG: DUF6625 family protein [Cyclobacteriaceae bacterium]
MNSPSIGMLYCYFGKLPWYFDLFVHSCKYNSTVNFLVYTDQSYAEQLPSNVIVKKLTAEQFKQQAAVKLGFDINLDYSYKLCDLKPAYGLIFEDDIARYDYWGLGDIDIIFGNLRNFLNDLSSVDVFCVRFEYVTGYFSLFRNIKTITRLFEKSSDYRKVFQSPEHYCFDECNFQFTPLGAGIHIKETSAEVESMTHVIIQESQSGNLRAHFDMHAVEGTPGDLKFIEGTLSYKNTFEVMLYHLIAFKKHPLLIKPKWNQVPDEYAIEKHFMVRENSLKHVATFILTARVVFKRISNTVKFLLNILQLFNPHPASTLKYTNYQSGSILAKLSFKQKKIIIDFTDTALTQIQLNQIPTFETPNRFTQLVLTPIGKNRFVSINKRAIVSFSYDSERKTDALEISVLNRESLKFFPKLKITP